MEERPEGTPNPLNPNLGAASLEADPSELPMEVMGDSTNPADLDLPVDVVEVVEMEKPEVEEVVEVEEAVEPTSPEIVEPEAEKPEVSENEVAEPEPVKVEKPEPKTPPMRPANNVRMIDMVRPMQQVTPVMTPPATPPTIAPVPQPTPPTSAPIQTDMIQQSMAVPPMQQPMQPVQPPMQQVQPVPGQMAVTQPEMQQPVMQQPMMQPAQPMQPAPQTQDPLATLGVVTNMDGTVSEPIDPTNRPMQKMTAPAEPPKRRRKVGPIIGLVVSLFLAVGCSVAAVLVLVSNNSKTDPVADAVTKMLSAEGMSNVMVDGEVNIDVIDKTSAISNAKLTIDTEMTTKSLINSTVARFSANLRDGNSYSLEVSEIFAGGDGLYLKLNGVTDLLNGIAAVSTTIVEEDGEAAEVTEVAETAEVTETEASGDEATIAESEVVVLPSSEDLLGPLEGSWVKIPLVNLSELLASTTSAGDTTCLADLAGDMRSGNGVVARLYNKNPFIGSADEEITVASQKDPIYKVAFNNANFANFVNEAHNSNVMNSLTSCMGFGTSVTETDVAEALQKMPEMFVEVNENQNFTRLYFTDEIKRYTGCHCPEGAQCFCGGNDGEEITAATVTADIRFSYPVNVNVPEPVDYKNLTEVLTLPQE